MAAGEDQAEPVVVHGALLGRAFLGGVRPRRLAPGMQQRGLGLPVLARCLPAEAVDRPVSGGGDDPASRARRQSGGRPPLHGCGAAVLAAEYALDLRPADGGTTGHQSRTSPCSGRTSIGRCVTSASLRADSSAASRSGSRKIVNPPTCSLPSVNGPSVVSVSPPLTRTTVAVLAGCSPALKTHDPAAFRSLPQASTPAMIGSSTSGGGGSPSGW